MTTIGSRLENTIKSISTIRAETKCQLFSGLAKRVPFYVCLYSAGYLVSLNGNRIGLSDPDESIQGFWLNSLSETWLCSAIDFAILLFSMGPDRCPQLWHCTSLSTCDPWVFTSLRCYPVPPLFSLNNVNCSKAGSMLCQHLGSRPAIYPAFG